MQRILRWHHWVDYGPFKGNKMNMRNDFHLDLEDGVNEYDMVLDRDFDYKSA